MGPRGAVAAARLGPLRAPDGRRDPALPVPRRRRGDPARLPPRRHDARREPAARAAPRGSRASGSRPACRSTGSGVGEGSVARWPAGSRPATRAWTSGRTERGVSATSYRDPGFAAGLGPRDVFRLLPAALPVRRGPGRPATAAVRALRAAPGGRARSSAPRPAGNGPTTTTRLGRWRRAGRDQAGYGWTRPPWFERVMAEARAVRERAGIVDLSSFGKIAVEGPGALGLLQRVSANDVDRPVGQRRLHAVVRRARRDGRRRDRHAAGRRPVPRRDRRRLPRVRDGLALVAHRATTTAPSRSETSAPT